jgi:pimeloyl-ACP methyl ester carboxylesterase
VGRIGFLVLGLNSSRLRAILDVVVGPDESCQELPAAPTTPARPALTLAILQGEIVRVRGVEEPPPDAGDVPAGYVAPPAELVVGNEWRLIPPLRAVAAGKTAMGALISAVVAQVQQNPGVSRGLLPAAPANLGMALADLAVTGRNAYTDFVRRRPREGGPGGVIETLATARLVAAGASGWTPAMISTATSEVLDRAYQVAWFLRAETDRGELGWIAVSGEDDPPHRPVNVARTSFSQHDLYFSVPGDQREVAVQTRFAIATADEPPAPPAPPAPGGRSLPPLLEPTLRKGDRIILFINGSDSRLEEADVLIPKLVRLPDGQPSGFSVLALDLPASAYASPIDHTDVGPWNPAWYPLGDLSFASPLTLLSLPISLLPFMEKFIIRFVAALSSRLGRPGLVESRLAAVIGGSLGGNLGLRLARRRWVRSVVAWDPGSVWSSLLRPASVRTNDPNNQLLLEGIMLSIPKVAVPVPENADGRDNFFKAVFDQPIPFSDPNWTKFKTQPEQWYRDDFVDKDQFIAMARFDRRETYSSQFAAWHWRVSLEELMWSWRDPAVQDFKSRILLGAGTDDDIPPARIFTNTAQLAVELANTDGDTFFFNHTGHSVHAERPQALANKIMEFLAGTQPRIETPPPVPAIWDLLLLEDEARRTARQPAPTTWELLLN